MVSAGLGEAFNYLTLHYTTTVTSLEVYVRYIGAVMIDGVDLTDCVMWSGLFCGRTGIFVKYSS